MRRIDKKPEAATTGFFYLDHIPTGKCYTGVAKNMQEAILDINGELMTGTCGCKSLVRLYKAEPDFKAYFEPLKTLKEARAREKNFRSEKPLFQLIN